ncbi:MAG: polysaccharide biosynthesis protein [Zoogloeaceae bacterium]|jgi:FlaA1/EpsC-like NDP-sugar epimerase|nr:polysaccharide biosynthesis protein [Zoogloeaceae bacterium]
MLIHRLAHILLELPRPFKRLLALGVDIVCCAISVWLAFYLRLEVWVSLGGGTRAQVFHPLSAFGVSCLIALPIFIRFGFYRAVFRYTGAIAIRTIALAMLCYGALYALVVTGMTLTGVPRAIGIIQPMLLFGLVAASRLMARYWLGGLYFRQIARQYLPRALIYGAGDTGKQLAMALAHSHEVLVVGFLDDDSALHGYTVNHMPVYNPAQLPGLVEEKKISSVLLALPFTSRKRRNEILAELAKSQVAVRSMPGLSDLAQGRVTLADLHEPDIDDLLGREPVTPDPCLLARDVAGKTVLVTGAGGSIGSELCRQILARMPATLLLIEQSEFALYNIHHELQSWLEGLAEAEASPVIVPLLASVCDEARMTEIMTAFHPDTVYHAAAYKHVPLVEHNPAQGLYNNAFGTLIAARVARKASVKRFVLISTDKAVRPTNIMGASKRLAEMVLQALAAEAGEMCFVMVRFGNVLGSSGSVVPRFRHQIHAGGPITLTHPEMTRYFMSIPEAAQLVIQAGAMAKDTGGDVFVLDMGEPVKIMDLAVRMVELSGQSIRDEDHPDGDIEIEITGLRSGEKLYEELLIGDDPIPTDHPRIMKAREAFLPWEELATRLDVLADSLATGDRPSIQTWLTETVSGYKAAPLVDWVWARREAEREKKPSD